MDKIVIALNLVIDYLDRVEAVNEKDISDYLVKTGFDDHEIRQVLTVLDVNVIPAFSGVRCFTKKEQNRLSSDAIKYLQKLYFTGILDMLTLESVIEASMESEAYPVDIEQIKNLALITLMERKSLFSDVDSFDEYLH